MTMTKMKYFKQLKNYNNNKNAESQQFDIVVSTYPVLRVSFFCSAHLQRPHIFGHSALTKSKRQLFLLAV